MTSNHPSNSIAPVLSVEQEFQHKENRDPKGRRNYSPKKEADKTGWFTRDGRMHTHSRETQYLIQEHLDYLTRKKSIQIYLTKNSFEH